MTKFYLKTLTVLVLLFTSTTLNSQCVVCVEAPALITCGETATLVGDGYTTALYSDNFNAGNLVIAPSPGALWNSISTGGTVNSICTSAPVPFANCSGGGVIVAGDYLWFPHGAAMPRQAETVPINCPAGGTIVFEFKMEAQSAPGCDGPDLWDEGILLEYNNPSSGLGWQTMGNANPPFNLNPAPFTNEVYFSPLNPQLQTMNGWKQYSIDINPAAYSVNTRFRWRQITATSTNWDFWGLENVNIRTIAPGASTYTWTNLSTGISTPGLTINVNPTSLTTYEFTYDPITSPACSTTVVVDVADPIVNIQQLPPNPLNPCAASEILKADVSFNTCNYKIHLYDNGGDGWVTLPQTASSIDNRLEVYVDGILVSTITMNPPAAGGGLGAYGPGTDQYGPVIYNFPISAAPGATFETRFMAGGPNPSECAYFITDNEDSLIVDPTSTLVYPNNSISAMGLSSPPPGSTPIWPIPTGLLPSVGFTVQPLDFGPITPTCLTANPYLYSWSITPGGSTAGITPPNTQTTSVVTALPQSYQVTVTDLTYPGCTATSTPPFPLPGNIGTWELDMIPDPSCLNSAGCMDLSFSGLNPYPVGGPYTIVVEMTDANGPVSNPYIIDNNGDLISTGLPINLCPTISAAVPSVSFNITSFIDNADPNGCEIPVINASQNVTFSTQPDAGTLLVTDPPTAPAEAERTFCSGDPTIDFATLFSILPNDALGEWTYVGTGPAPNMPYTGLNYMFDPSTDPAGLYTYTIVNLPCLNDQVTLEIILDPGPIAGDLGVIPVDKCITDIWDLNSLFIIPPTPNTPVWTNITGGGSLPLISSWLNPTLEGKPPGTYSFRSTITDPTSSCPAVWADITIVVKKEPYAGTRLNPTKTFCTDDGITDLATLFSNVLLPDAGGEWTYVGTGPAPNMPYTGLNYMFDPSTDPPGVYTYTVVNPPCAPDDETITINIETPPTPGQLPLVNVNACVGQPIDLNSLFAPLPVPNTPVWTDITGGIPGTNISNNFPSLLYTSGTYILRSTITNAAPTYCPSKYKDITIDVHDVPNVSFSSTSETICDGENLDLGFILTGTPPFIITISDNSIPPNIINPEVDINGNDNVTGLPINVVPPNMPITNYNISYISTNTANNTCGTPVSHNLAVTVLTAPNSGVLDPPGSTGLKVCSDDNSIYDLKNQLAGQDIINGSWIEPNGNQTNSSSFNFQHPTNPAGNYIYEVTSAACPTVQTIVPVAIITEPNIGIANPQSICINNYGPANLYNLDNLLAGSPDPGIWYESGIPIPTNIDPNTYGLGPTTFTYQVNGTPPCLNATNPVNLTINPEPVVVSFTSSSLITTQGYPIDLDVTMSAGTAPFIIELYDNNTPADSSNIFIPVGNFGQVTVSANVVPITNYNISLITDLNGCTTSLAPTVPVNVVPYPIINPFTAVTPEVCEGNDATIEFELTQGVLPVTVDYSINGTSYSKVLNLIGANQVTIPFADLNFGLNTFSISNIVDNLGEPTGDPLPNDIYVDYNQNPSVNPINGFSTPDSEICYEDDAILQFGFLTGTPPFTVRYRDNGIELLPALSFNNLGNQTTLLSPDPLPGNHAYDIINIEDVKGCLGTIIDPLTALPKIVNIEVRELPNLDIIISGDNPMCEGLSSEIEFPVLVPGADPLSFPYTLSILEGNLNRTLSINSVGLIDVTNLPHSVSPSTTTTYTLISVRDDYGCEQNLSNSIILTVNEKPEVNVSGTAEICKGEYTNINFDFSAGKADWTIRDWDIDGVVGAPFDLSDTSDNMPVSPTTTSTYTFTAIEDDNGCENNFIDAVTITVNQLPETEVTGGGEVCDDDSSTVDVIFNISSGTPTFDFEYTFGINTKSVWDAGYQTIIPTNEAGTYKIKNVVDSKGCIGQSNIGSVDVIINPMPVADFDMYPQPADVTNPIIYFIDNSADHALGTWDFDDNSSNKPTNFGKLPHRFPDSDSGTYYVELYVESDKGCAATQVQKVIIDKAFIFYIPNSFTPDNDMVNDKFLPYVDGVKEYDFYIYSRHGQEIFHTSNVNEGWDGYIVDQYALPGKYSYVIYIIDLHGKERIYQGDISLFR